jgi:hypothetical protein
MANGLFIEAGRDLPGAISRGLRERDVRESRGLSLARQRAGQAGLIEQDQFALEAAQRSAELGLAAQPGLLEQQQFTQATAQDKFELDSVISGAQQVSVIPTKQGQLDFLKNRQAEIVARGGNAEHTDEGIALLEQAIRTGDSTEFDQSIQDILSLRGSGEKAGAGQFTIGSQRFDAQGNVIATGAQTVEPVSALDQAKTAKLQAETKVIETPPVPVKKLSSVQQKVAAEGVDPFSEEGQQRARELNQRSGIDPSRAPTNQEIINRATEGQLASASFASRVKASNEIMLDLEKKEGFDPTSLQASLFSSVKGGNIVLTEDQQLYQQAKEDVITAILRKESGAAIGVDEFAKEDKKLFPQLGDKPAVLIQKQKARQRAFKNLSNQSKGVFDAQQAAQQVAQQVAAGQELPEGVTDNGDGTFTLADGRIVRRK